MRTAVQTLVLVMAFASLASASNFPCSAHGACCFLLWDTLRESERIVLAEVELPEGFERGSRPVQGDGSWAQPDGRMALRVLETWKGAEVEDLLLSPQPGRWATAGPGSRGVFFIDADGRWSFCDPLAGVGSARRIVQSGLRLQLVPLPEQDLRRLWFVESASHGETRQQALRLMPNLVDVRGLLTDQGRAAIAAGFLEHPPERREAMTLLGLLEGHDSAELDAAAIALLETDLSSQRAQWDLDRLFLLVLRRLGDGLAEARVAELTRPVRIADVRAAWASARLELGPPAAD